MSKEYELYDIVKVVCSIPYPLMKDDLVKIIGIWNCFGGVIKYLAEPIVTIAEIQYIIENINIMDWRSRGITLADSAYLLGKKYCPQFLYSDHISHESDSEVTEEQSDRGGLKFL
jgi:hypothetical protein